ncbi:hypothetical protein F4777DRAFT_575903 [Nemania sp. FL0916]|nr:hypothetical protein F4777DRAFT_575903 [Nemania sp. FL0916]
MSHHKAHVRTSRRAPPLADKDIDHEISLVDHDDPTAGSRPSRDIRPLSSRTNQSMLSSPITNEPLDRSESQAPLTQHAGESGKRSNDGQPEAGPSRASSAGQNPAEGNDDNDVEAAVPDEIPGTAQIDHVQTRPGRASTHNTATVGHRSRPKEPESEIDILYENQRGGFLCGIPLFSSAALGNLDPPAWTNFAHKPSLTDTHTAQVPDPSWQWAWPEWRINHDNQIQADGDGWEYSFMFSKKFSWHRPSWYNSFVRRRAWIRRRVKIKMGYETTDEQAMNPAYFKVATKRRTLSPFAVADEVERTSMDRRSRGSRTDSRRSRDISRGDTDNPRPPLEIKTAEDLVTILKQSRIDREKLEAAENYISNCTDDLLHLQDHMHEIMSMFVFQTSRKTLLARLTQLYDDVSSSADEEKSAKSKAGNLAEAIKHADEEVRRLEYWSDIKGMAEDGEAIRAVDHRDGWDKGWQGLDQSGAKGIDADKMAR